MKWTDVADNWSSYVPRVLTRWPKLDETDVAAIDGDQDALVAAIITTYALPASEAQDELAEWLSGAEPADVVMDDAHANSQIAASAQDIPEGETPMDDDKAFGDDAQAENPVGRL